jgi:hypothetical protein
MRGSRKINNRKTSRLIFSGIFSRLFNITKKTQEKNKDGFQIKLNFGPSHKDSGLKCVKDFFCVGNKRKVRAQKCNSPDSRAKIQKDDQSRRSVDVVETLKLAPVYEFMNFLAFFLKYLFLGFVFLWKF